MAKYARLAAAEEDGGPPALAQPTMAVSSTNLDVSVRSELALNMIPLPADYLPVLSPPAQVYLLREMAVAVLASVISAAQASADDADEREPVLDDAINGVSAAVVGATQTCVALAVLPPEALSAIEAAASAPAPLDEPEQTEQPQLPLDATEMTAAGGD